MRGLCFPRYDDGSAGSTAAACLACRRLKPETWVAPAKATGPRYPCSRWHVGERVPPLCLRCRWTRAPRDKGAITAASSYEHPSVLRCDRPQRLGSCSEARIRGRQRSISGCSLRCCSTRMAITFPTICPMPSTESPSATQPANEKRTYLVRYLVRCFR